MNRNQEPYRTWKQTDPAFNEKEAWPKEQFPRAHYHYLKDTGCLLTSLSIMLRHFGIEKETEERKFNPWILHERLLAAGVYDEVADLCLQRVHRVYPIEYCGSVPFSKETLQRVAGTGEPFLIAVPGQLAPRHFIAPDHPEGDTFTVFDPNSEKQSLEEYPAVLELRIFWTPQSGAPLGNRTVIR